MALNFHRDFDGQMRSRRFGRNEENAIYRTAMALGNAEQMRAAANAIHRVDGDEGWWSCYVNKDLRIIFRRGENGDVWVCWVDHHDAAYIWARRHKFRANPATGELEVMRLPGEETPKAATYAGTTEEEAISYCAANNIREEDLLGWGIAPEWTERVLGAGNEDALLELAEELPGPEAEVLLKIAAGERPEAVQGGDGENGEETADGEALWRIGGRDWRVVSTDEELRVAVESPGWDAWCAYLHPRQRNIAYRTYATHRRVCGSAGTGKTVVALHHAKHLLASDGANRVLVVTYSERLADDLWRRCRVLLTPGELERCKASGLVEAGKELYREAFGTEPRVIGRDELRKFALEKFREAEGELPQGCDARFAWAEFERVIEPRQLGTLEEYLNARRRGVRVTLARGKREAIWRVAERMRKALKDEKAMMTSGEMFGALARHYRDNPGVKRKWTRMVVDECQDLCEVELDFITAYLGAEGTAFFAGDMGQRIIRYSFPWSGHGVDLRGKSRTLKVNYRTTRQIREMADRLADLEGKDADGVEQNRKGTVSVLSGQRPAIRGCGTQEEEEKLVAQWVGMMTEERGVGADEIAIICRSEAERARAERAAALCGGTGGKPKVLEMFEAKGLEFRAVAVMACDNEAIPSTERLMEGGVMASLEEVMETERNLLYVACTRARDGLLITYTGTPSEFIFDIKEKYAGDGGGETISSR